MPANNTQSHQRFISNLPRMNNIKIPTSQEIAAMKICYPPTPPNRIVRVGQELFDLEGDVMMRDLINNN
jgi:hypothetical protein